MRSTLVAAAPAPVAVDLDLNPCACDMGGRQLISSGHGRPSRPHRARPAGPGGGDRLPGGGRPRRRDGAAQRQQVVEPVGAPARAHAPGPHAGRIPAHHRGRGRGRLGARRARRHRPGDDRRALAGRGPGRAPDGRGEPDRGGVPRPGLAGPLPAYPSRPPGQPRGRQLRRGARPGDQRRGAGRVRRVAERAPHGRVDDRRPRRARGGRRARPPVGATAYAGHAGGAGRRRPGAPRGRLGHPRHPGPGARARRLRPRGSRSSWPARRR